MQPSLNATQLFREVFAQALRGIERMIERTKAQEITSNNRASMVRQSRNWDLTT